MAGSFPKHEITLWQIKKKKCIQTGFVLHLDPCIAGKSRSGLAPTKGPFIIQDHFLPKTVRQPLGTEQEDVLASHMSKR